MKSIENFSVADDAEDTDVVRRPSVRRETLGSLLGTGAYPWVDDWWTEVRERDQPLFAHL